MTAIFTTKLTSVSQLFYQSLGSSRAPQEKADRILEPMQVMIQLALLSFCPTGTKLCVNDNLLSLQLPTLSQGVWRWYNKDSKDDLFFEICHQWLLLIFLYFRRALESPY